MSGRSDVYTTQDTLSGANGVDLNVIDLTLTDIGTTGAAPSVITYGTLDNTHAIAVGSSVSSSSTSCNLVQPRWAAHKPDQLWRRHSDWLGFRQPQRRSSFRCRCDRSLRLNQCHGGGHLHQSDRHLPAGFNRPTSVEFITNNGVNALLVGGLNSPLTCNSTPNGCVISSHKARSWSRTATIGSLSGLRAFGIGLPNVLV